MASALAASYCGVKGGGKKRVVLLGFDGANWPTIDPLIEAGKLPYLKQLRDASAWASFKTFKPTKSNVVWSSIASGKTMMKHGIMDFAYLKKNGVKVPYSKSERKAPMIWQILDEYHHRSVVVNWWVSHPPDPINGVMISDHFRRMVWRDPDKEPQFATAVHPTAYFKKLRQLSKRPDYQELLRQADLSDFYALFYQRYPNGNIRRTVTLKDWEGFVRQDELVRQASEYLYQKEDFDFFATYLRLPDIAQHSVTHLMDRDFKAKLIAAFKEGDISDQMLDDAVLQVSEILEPVYRYMERAIRFYMENERGSDTTFLIMSDHGFSFYPGGYNHYGLPEGYEPPDGIFLMKGPQVRPGKLDASVLDIAPTILYLFGHPVGQNMDGKALRKAFTFQRALRRKPYTLKKTSPGKRDKSYDEETLKEMETLGYVKS
jgi:predicted AlkP superfamily phosphohydrolase/phosphomutase